MKYTVEGLYEYKDLYQVISDDGTVIFQGRKRTCEKLAEVENIELETDDED